MRTDEPTRQAGGTPCRFRASSRTRPAAKYLTGFYVALSFGGMLGGLFAGLIAPFTFSWVAEYPILLALAALCRPAGDERLPRWSRWYWPFLAVLAVA